MSVVPDPLAEHLPAGGTYRPDGGWDGPTVSSPDGSMISHTLISAEGVRQIRRLSELTRLVAPSLVAMADWIIAEGKRCEHGWRIGDLIESDALEWVPNDYAFDPLTEGNRAVWMLWGQHPDPPRDWTWCMPYWFELVPGGGGRLVRME